MASSKRGRCAERHERLRPSLPLVTRGDIQLLFFPSLLPPTPSTPPFLNLYRRRTRFAGIGGEGREGLLPAFYQQRRCSHFGGVAIFTWQDTRTNALARVHSARRQDTCVSWFAFGLINREATPTFRGPFHPSPIRLRPFSWSGRIYVVSYTDLSFSFSSLFTPFFNYRSSENYSPNNSLKVFLFSDLSFIVNFQFHSQTDQITFLLLRTLENAEISYEERERERDSRRVANKFGEVG